MITANTQSCHQRVLVLAPIFKDADVTRATLQRAGIACTVCDSLNDLCREIDNGAGAAILSEEAIAPEVLKPLITTLHNQPEWSDFPLLVLAANADSPAALNALQTLGNVTLLERPVHPLTLISSVKSALRARQRQMQMRDHLAESEELYRQRAESEVFRHRKILEHLVAERTAELERSHQQLRLSERMAALGTLSTGLGHDMGNLLLPIRARIDAMKQTLKHDTNGVPSDTNRQLYEHLNAIRQCTDYLQSLTNGLRLLALDPNDPDAAGHETTLDHWWPNVEALMRNALPRHVELMIEGFGPALREGRPLPPMAVAPHRLTQAVFNIVKNAGDALRPAKHGRVCISAAKCAAASISKGDSGNGHERHAIAAGTFVRLSVTDNGPGMSEDVKARAAEPFFTTKTRGISTGLGLSLVHGIVTAAGGSMKIESALGRGTTLVLNLPVATANRRSLSRRRPPAVVTLPDDRHRTMVRQVLSSLGYEVQVSNELEPPSSASLWVTESSPDHLHAAEEFLERGEGRVVLVAGQVDEHKWPGMFSMGEPLRFSRIRDIIRDLRTEVQERAV